MDNFLTPFGLRSVGSVEACDFDALLAEALRLLDNKPAFQTRSRAVRQEQLTRLDTARAQLKKTLA